MSKLVLTIDGRLTKCVAGENIGKGRCNHVQHQMEGEDSSSFILRANMISNLKNSNNQFVKNFYKGDIKTNNYNLFDVKNIRQDEAMIMFNIMKDSPIFFKDKIKNLDKKEKDLLEERLYKNALFGPDKNNLEIFNNYDVLKLFMNKFPDGHRDENACKIVDEIILSSNTGNSNKEIKTYRQVLKLLKENNIEISNDLNKSTFDELSKNTEVLDYEKALVLCENRGLDIQKFVNGFVDKSKNKKSMSIYEFIRKEVDGEHYKIRDLKSGEYCDIFHGSELDSVWLKKKDKGFEISNGNWYYSLENMEPSDENINEIISKLRGIESAYKDFEDSLF